MNIAVLCLCKHTKQTIIPNMRRNEKTLTRLEFEVMSILWNLGRPACAWDVLGSCKYLSRDALSLLVIDFVIFNCLIVYK